VSKCPKSENETETHICNHYTVPLPECEICKTLEIVGKLENPCFDAILLSVHEL
jgi:hypothetical protein